MNYTLVAGNWKLNPSKEAEAKKLSRKFRIVAAELKKTDIAICPPSIYLKSCRAKTALPRFHLGAQTVAWQESGSHTGLVSVSMLKDMNVEYVIVGHSEERARGEDDETVAKKVKAVLDGGLMPIVCIGEKVRDEGGQHFEFIKDQVKAAFALVPKSHSRDVIIAYEPIWAIGAAEAMNPDQIYEISLFIKKVFADMFGADTALKLRVLYGGAVNARNAVDIIKTGRVDGLLVGRESLNAGAFKELLLAVDTI